ncbi:methyltransferase domain-containing protein [Tumebacillus sp. ITR2]|uniref:Methyltransferase domain-containing protein n=1 Tax=Tumebacillus amylolyticus TaxID=2801339 RepID=A0ABS1J907_9BACL|nr:class I SAM-dependent methyltransferase [Tumebacillus amylolyticus]MBL0386761.1 methyltransferase domain-containing protein [Tumebacillus amylolyticus]
MVIKPMLAYVRTLLTEVLNEGDVAVDATVGNGHDTLFLAQLVGESGRVYGFDIQAEALASARARLEEAGVAERAAFFLESHAEMREFVPAGVKAVTFNLGYLPGGDLSVVTTEASTVPALQAALDLLVPGGILSVMLYAGHDEGKVESEAVLDWAHHLHKKEAHVLMYRFWNQKNSPPILLAIEKRGRL